MDIVSIYCYKYNAMTTATNPPVKLVSYHITAITKIALNLGFKSTNLVIIFIWNDVVVKFIDLCFMDTYYTRHSCCRFFCS